jgi:ferredoxin
MTPSTPVRAPSAPNQSASSAPSAVPPAPKAEAPKPVAATPAPAPAAPASADVGGKFTGNPKDVGAVKAFAAKLPEAKKAWVVAADCIVCNGCQAACPTDAAIVTDMARVDRDLCVSDGACIDACPTGAIRLGVEEQAKSGGWPKGSRLAGKFGTPEA